MKTHDVADVDQAGADVAEAGNAEDDAALAARIRSALEHRYSTGAGCGARDKAFGLLRDWAAGDWTSRDWGAEGVAAVWVAWRKCVDMDPNVFFPHDGAGVIAAQKVCADCPVKVPCRDYALANNIPHGVWGGTSERQRRRILRDRRRARRTTND